MLCIVKTAPPTKSRTYAPLEFRAEDGETPPLCSMLLSSSSHLASVPFGRCVGCPSSLLIQREWYRWWPYDERRNPGRRARALAEITRSMGRGTGQRNREGPQQSTRSD